MMADEMQKESSELWAKIKPGTQDNMVGFTFLDGQFLDSEQDDDQGDTWLVIDLGDKDDTTTAQELFLNTNPNITEWTIR